MTYLVRESLERKLDELDEKDQGETKSEHLRQPAATRSIVPFDQRRAPEVPINETHDRLAHVFEEHAARIAEVATDPLAVEQRRIEASRVIKSLAPITYAGERGDRKIVERIEAIIIKAGLEAQSLSVPSQEEPPSSAMMTNMAASFLEKMRQLSPPPEAEEPVITQINTKRVRKRTVVITNNEADTDDEGDNNE